jgi:hypothetical protein
LRHIAVLILIRFLFILSRRLTVVVKEKGVAALHRGLFNVVRQTGRWKPQIPQGDEKE